MRDVIILTTNEPIKIPKELKGHIKEKAHNSYVTSYIICNLQECFNIYAEIKNAFQLLNVHNYSMSLNIKQIKILWNILNDFDNPLLWDDNKTFWNYDEIADKLHYSLMALEWLISFLRNNTSANATYLHSY